MRYRETLSLLLLVAATACAGVSEGPTAPTGLDARLSAAGVAASDEDDDGEPPPPPIDTGVAVETSGDGAYNAGARYFQNNPGTISWIQFESAGTTIASPDARLMYNSITKTTTGVGTLRNGTSVLDLSQVQFISDGFEKCPVKVADERAVPCGTFSYTDGAGRLQLAPRPTRGEVDVIGD